MSNKINVTVWNEFVHERKDEDVKAIYPDGIHNTISNQLVKNDDVAIKTATLDQPEHGLTDEVLNSTDVLIWWAHVAHNRPRDLSGLPSERDHSGNYQCGTLGLFTVPAEYG